jgi:acyl carrier protein
MLPMSPEERVRQFIVQQWLEGEDADLSYDEPLFSSGLLDSFAVSELILFLEDLLQVRIPVSQVRIDDFDTVAQAVAATRRVGKPAVS